MAGKIHTNISGTYKQVKKLYVNASGVWKGIKKAYTRVAGVWKQIHGSGSLPAGIILPYASNNAVPSGFTEFTSANNKLIRGAGSTYTAGTSGGDNTVSISVATNSTGSHTRDSSLSTSYNINANGNYANGNYNAGSHTHTVTGSREITPPTKTYRLVKANSEISTVPQNVCVLTHSTVSNMTLESNTNFLKANTTFNTVSSGNASINCSSSSSGSHTHGSSYNGGWSGGYGEDGDIRISSGSHTHTATLTGTINPLHKYLALYKNATQAVDVGENMIGMYEGSTAPDGWCLCDGTSGTPDMRNFFLRLGTNANKNTSGGSNNTTFSGSTTTAPSHSHRVRKDWNEVYVYGKHHFFSYATPAHTASKSVAYTPEYYALTFIMKLP